MPPGCPATCRGSGPTPRGRAGRRVRRPGRTRRRARPGPTAHPGIAPVGVRGRPCAAPHRSGSGAPGRSEHQPRRRRAGGDQRPRRFAAPARVVSSRAGVVRRCCTAVVSQVATSSAAPPAHRSITVSSMPCRGGLPRKRRWSSERRRENTQVAGPDADLMREEDGDRRRRGADQSMEVSGRGTAHACAITTDEHPGPGQSGPVRRPGGGDVDPGGQALPVFFPHQPFDRLPLRPWPIACSRIRRRPAAPPAAEGPDRPSRVYARRSAHRVSPGRERSGRICHNRRNWSSAPETAGFPIDCRWVSRGRSCQRSGPGRRRSGPRRRPSWPRSTTP